MKVIRRWQGLLVCALACCAFGAHAQQDTKQSRERDLLRRQAEQMRQLESERATLQQEHAKVAGEKAALQRDLDAARKKVVALDGAVRNKLHQTETDLEAARVENARLQTQLAGEQTANAERERRIAALEAQLAEANALATRLGGTLAEREHQVEVCSGRNQQLAATGREILDRLTDGRCGSSSDFHWEPFVQAGRVRFENTVESYRDKLAEQRHAPSAAQ